MYLVNMGASIRDACVVHVSDHCSGDGGGDLGGSKPQASGPCHAFRIAHMSDQMESKNEI
jgi:hypothetical protein